MKLLTFSTYFEGLLLYFVPCITSRQGVYHPSEGERSGGFPFLQKETGPRYPVLRQFFHEGSMSFFVYDDDILIAVFW